MISGPLGYVSPKRCYEHSEHGPNVPSVPNTSGFQPFRTSRASQNPQPGPLKKSWIDILTILLVWPRVPTADLGRPKSSTWTATTHPSIKESTKGGGRRRRPPPFVEAARRAVQPKIRNPGFGRGYPQFSLHPSAWVRKLQSRA